MPKMKLDAIAVTSRDMAQSAKFYSLLGFSFAEIAPDAKHIEALTAPGEVRFMIDDAAMMTGILGHAPAPQNHSAFAVKCESPAALDAAVSAIAAAGFTVVKAPWDAVWGQRYAIVADPEGYRADMFAALPAKS